MEQELLLYLWRGAGKYSVFSMLQHRNITDIYIYIYFFSIGNIAVQRRLIIILTYIPWTGGNGCLISITYQTLPTVCFKCPISFYHKVPVSSFDRNLFKRLSAKCVDVCLSVWYIKRATIYIGWAGIGQSV
jgi:hypothetical protein